jgi:hypothetical protein
MLPLTFLSAMLALTVAASAWQFAQRHRTASLIRRLAIDSDVNYSETDRFQLTPRVVAGFPIPGASDVKLSDLLYRREGDRYRYVFTVEFTLGVVRTKRRLRRVATFCEPRDRGASGTPTAVVEDGFSPLVLAPANLPLKSQYQHLCGACSGEGHPAVA